MSLHHFSNTGYVFDTDSLYHRLQHLDDGRYRRGIRYPLALVLLLVVLAKMAGENTVRGIATWLRLRQELFFETLQLGRKTMPHHTTISRILERAVSVEQLDTLIGEFGQSIHDQKLKIYEEQQAGTKQWAIICIDGKMLRGTIPIGETQGKHLLAAWEPDKGFVLMQLAVDKKENEIVAAPRLLALIDINGRVIVGDAMHTQRNISIQIVKAGGNFIWFVKKNQMKLHDAIVRLFTEPEMRPGHHAVANDFQTATHHTKGHGRVETRRLTTSSMLNGYVDFPYCGQVFQLERQVVHLRAGKIVKKTVEIAWGITNLYAFEATPEEILRLTRHYWQIENGLHYRRDVTFKEDACRLHNPTAQHVMASLNNLTLSLLLFQPHEKTVADEQRFYAANQAKALQRLIRSPDNYCV